MIRIADTKCPCQPTEILKFLEYRTDIAYLNVSRICRTSYSAVSLALCGSAQIENSAHTVPRRLSMLCFVQEMLASFAPTGLRVSKVMAFIRPNRSLI